MELKIVRADPAGNITVFVMSPLPDSDSGAALVNALLNDPALGAQQVGFVTPPEKEGALWKLNMMGGEFCGNAARSFGLLVARETGLFGRVSLMIETSGVRQPLRIDVDTVASSAEVEIPAPRAETNVEFEGRVFPLYLFEGISHVIAVDTVAEERLVRGLMEQAAQTVREPENSLDAFGVMFYDTRKNFLCPAVCVKSTGTLVFESSCGSGSAALAVWLARNSGEADECYEIAQPGGIITARVIKNRGVAQKIRIGGRVTLEPSYLY
ncbi:MAG TPA: hypothetical protein DEQ14_07055 [Treponema sp.]|nr:hypothetical protein [Treponema sp.]